MKYGRHRLCQSYMLLYTILITREHLPYTIFVTHRRTYHEAAGLRVEVRPVSIGQCLLKLHRRDRSTPVRIHGHKPRVDGRIYARGATSGGTTLRGIPAS